MMMDLVGADDDAVSGPVTGQLSTRQGSLGVCWSTLSITGHTSLGGIMNPPGWGRAVEWVTNSHSVTSTQ